MQTIFDLSEVWLPGDAEPAVDIEHHFRIMSVFNINSYVGLDVHGSGGLVAKGHIQKEWPLAAVAGLKRILGEWLEVTASDPKFQPEARWFDEGLPMAMLPATASPGLT